MMQHAHLGCTGRDEWRQAGYTGIGRFGGSEEAPNDAPEVSGHSRDDAARQMKGAAN